MSPQPKVLVFTASAKRPIYLRHCLLQMQQQTYPLDHAVYLNSPEYKSPDTDPHNYMSLVDDIIITKGKKIHIGYGPTASHHKNHMAQKSRWTSAHQTESRYKFEILRCSYPHQQA